MKRKSLSMFFLSLKPRENFNSVDSAKVPGLPGLYHRRYENGEVFVNPAGPPQEIQLSSSQEAVLISGGTVEAGGRLAWRHLDRVTIGAREGLIIKQ